MKKILLLLSVLIGHLGISQTTEPSEVRSEIVGEQDPASNDIGKSDLEVTDSVNVNLKKIKNYYKDFTKTEGWRIQVYSGTDREEAAVVQREVTEILTAALGEDIPEIYEIFDRPYVRIKIGDCLEKLQAHQVLVILTKDERYKNALLVPDKINLSKIK